MSPQRIQRKRIAGWRMPEGAVYVGRPTRWGNPFSAAPAQYGDPDDGSLSWCVVDREGIESGVFDTKADATADAVRLYVAPTDLSAIRGRDLACWCPLDQPCHGDVLLALANPSTDPDG